VWLGYLLVRVEAQQGAERFASVVVLEAVMAGAAALAALVHGLRGQPVWAVQPLHRCERLGLGRAEPAEPLRIRQAEQVGLALSKTAPSGGVWRWL
jgi:hypothetical protein